VKRGLSVSKKNPKAITILTTNAGVLDGQKKAPKLG
jgi:hypothetical protein